MGREEWQLAYIEALEVPVGALKILEPGALPAYDCGRGACGPLVGL